MQVSKQRKLSRYITRHALCLHCTISAHMLWSRTEDADLTCRWVTIGCHKTTQTTGCKICNNNNVSSSLCINHFLPMSVVWNGAFKKKKKPSGMLRHSQLSQWWTIKCVVDTHSHRTLQTGHFTSFHCDPHFILTWAWCYFLFKSQEIQKKICCLFFCLLAFVITLTSSVMTFTFCVYSLVWRFQN